MKNRSEVIHTLRSMFTRKDALLSIIREEFGLNLPPTISYAQLLDTISRHRLDKRFCRRIFHASSFEEGARLVKLRSVLYRLSWGDLRDLALMLSSHEKLWKINKSRKKTIADAIIHNCSATQVERGLYQYVGEIAAQPVMQYDDMVVGPMGITFSVADRSDIEASYWIDFLSKHLDVAVCRDVIARATFVPKIDLGKQDIKSKTTQMLLTYGTDSNIIGLFNQLLEDESIKIDTREDYWDFIATPVGVFEKEYADPIEQLAEVLVANLRESVLREELKLGSFRDEDLREQIVGASLMRKPNEMLNELFSLPELRKVAKKMRLVKVDTTDKGILTEVLLLKIGFEVPKVPHGLISVLHDIRANIRNVPAIDVRTLTGIVTNAFVRLEGLLKDLVLFYTVLLWNSELETEGSGFDDDAPESALNSLSEFLSNEFDVKPFTRLTLGELIDLLSRMDSDASHDKDKKSTLKSDLGRCNIVTEAQKIALRKINAKRRMFTHHGGSEPSKELCKSTLNEMFDLLEDFASSRIYPYLVLITGKTTDEYGITKASAVDEEETIWVIKSDSCDPAHQYMFHSNSIGLAIDPSVVRRFWEPGG